MADLTAKQRLFIVHYCDCWNATDAAERAGYGGKKATRASLAVTGSETLRNPKIAAAIQEHISAIMPAGEVLQRLADIARGSMEDILDPDTETLDLQKAYREKKLHLIKRFTRSDTETGTRISVELYSKKDALELLGKHHGLFREVIDLNFNPDDFTPDQLRRISAGESPDKVKSGG